MKLPPTKAERERAARYLDLDEAAAELADLGVSREVLKALHKGGKANIEKSGAKRRVARSEVERLRAFLAEKLADDPEWLADYSQRQAGARATREVVRGTGFRQPKQVALTDAPGRLPPRTVVKAPSSR